MIRALADMHRFFAVHPLTRNARLKAWWRFVAWQIKSCIAAELVVPWIEGQRLAVRRGMTGATGNIYAGLHEFTDMMLALHFLREGDLFLDIGANVGTYTVLASGICRAKTWAFEPDPDTARRLRRNLEINSLSELATLHELALGDSEGEVAFTVGLDTVNKAADAGVHGVRIVHQQRLDNLIGEQEPAMIKMDVEGYEEPALRGAQSVLTKPSLKLIELETVTPWASEMLESRGFERAYYDPFARKLLVKPTGFHSSNAVYVRDKEVVEQRLAAAKPVMVLGQSI
jgi:FkbM family methyltransferase